jgi:hypothetical protein
MVVIPAALVVTVAGDSAVMIPASARRLVLFGRKFVELAQEGDDGPQFVVAVGRSLRRHAGHLDAMLCHPEQLARGYFLGRFAEIGGRRL